MRRRAGVELAGYLDAAVGSGEVARRYLGALQSAGVAVRARNVALEGRDSAMTPVRPARSGRPWATRFNLLCLNPEQLVPYLGSDAAPRRRGRTSVAAWNWEVDVVPSGWTEAARAVSEVWTCSEFTATFIRDATGAQVVAMPPPLSLSAKARPAPPPALPPGFRVLLIFDYLSTIERKNPLGAIAAYRRCFAPGDGAQLVIKTMNGVHRPERRREVEAAAADRSDIVLIDATISGAERDALIAASDCLLSLHRSEGFGLALAEAIAAGKPVIATAYGGNVEFMPAASSYLVRYGLTRVGDGCEHYPAEARWAEPDIDHAAAQLRAVFDHREGARERAGHAQDHVLALLAPERIGRLMRDRLRGLRKPPGAGPPV
jgi:glycosyltransferase involved in cell wall biosynthesis